MLLNQWLLPNDGGWRETKTLLWGLTLLYLFYFLLWLGQWQVNHEQLKKNLAVIWGVLM